MYNILCVVFFLVKDWSSTWRYMLRLQTSHRKLQLVKIIEKYPRRLGSTWLHTGGTMVDDGCKKCGGEGNAATAATWAVSVFGSWVPRCWAWASFHWKIDLHYFIIFTRICMNLAIQPFKRLNVWGMFDLWK